MMNTLSIDGLGGTAPLRRGQGQAQGSKSASSEPEIPLLTGSDPAPDAAPPPKDVVSIDSPPAVSLSSGQKPVPPGLLRAAVNLAENLPSSETVSAKIQEIVDRYAQRATGLDFKIERQDGGEVVVKVINRESGDLVRQIPPDEILRLQEALGELAKGGLLSQVS